MAERRGFRVTTWNVNGIRNPFGYQPWRQERTFAAMFDILEADIVVLQETKIQRKDLSDDMVLVPGWDVFFSLPKHKKGYSGVAIYTRNATCAPIRAEEGITGVLTPPNSTTSFRDLPKFQQIGGYPTTTQLSDTHLDAATLDSEGRCMILEFPAFVLIGTYCPANRDESRDDFRLGFLNALDARVRNLVAAGKRVFLTGDLNIIRDELDTAKLDETLKKQGITAEDYLATPARRLLNQLLVGGKVFGEPDEGREKPIMWDICRAFHPTRQGMFTCWEQKINARPGNFGSRIDYVLCSEGFRDWFCDSNIQEGLMGSDHCPVYAVFKDKVNIDGAEVDFKDLMSYGMYFRGAKEREWSIKDLLPMSAKLIPEFDRRRSIRDMFTKRPSLLVRESTASNTDLVKDDKVDGSPISQETLRQENAQPKPSANTEKTPPPELTLKRELTTSSTRSPVKSFTASPIKTNAKRPSEAISGARPDKKGKTGSSTKITALSKGQMGKGQSSLTGFFKPMNPKLTETAEGDTLSMINDDTKGVSEVSVNVPDDSSLNLENSPDDVLEGEVATKPFNPAEQKDVVDPIVAKETWSKLLAKRVVPQCEHNEPCKSMLTKKSGVNCGRSFYMCQRPLGPSGQKEKNTQWRCGTFIWSSDWTKDGS